MNGRKVISAALGALAFSATAFAQAPAADAQRQIEKAAASQYQQMRQQAARPGHIAIDYQEVAGGAALTYRTAAPELAAALHRWIDAQVSDHGPDAMAGHGHHGHDAAMKQ